MSKNKQVLVDLLVRGSAEINRKKDEIRAVTSVVKGAIGTGFEQTLNPNGLSFLCDKECRWAVFLSGDKLMIELWWGRSGPRLYSSAEGTVNTRYVELIHECLGDLVGGLQEKISDFDHLISPYIAAAPRLESVG